MTEKALRVYTHKRANVCAKGLIFDMDGVLFDTERDSIPNIIETAGEMGFIIEREFIIENMGRNMAEASVIYTRHLGSGFDAEEFWRRYWTKRNRKYDREGIPLKDGAVKLLKIAKERGVSCTVASSSPKEEVWRAIDRAGLREYFIDVTSGDMFERSKPEPDIFLAGADVLGLPPEKCLAIEDSLNGLKAARAAGMLVAFVQDIPSYPDSELEKYCDFSSASAEDLSDLL